MNKLPPYAERTWRHYRNKVDRFSIDASSLLEFGSGYGYMLEAWKRLRNGPAVGVEIDHSRVELIKRKGFVCHEHDIKYPLSFIESGSFDATISLQMIEHLDDERQENYFSESYRILKPGGEIYIESPSRNIDDGGLYVYGHINCLTPKELVKRLKFVGFVEFDLSANGCLYQKDIPDHVVDDLWSRFKPDILSSTCHVKARKPANEPN
jgi:SAM-dependent methyltransferase